MKGIILAGGTGTRLYPLTRALSKQLLPVYDKPMIYYPLSTLMLGGIRDILVITTPDDRAAVSTRSWATAASGASRSPMRCSRRRTASPQAFLIGRDFIAGEGCALVLGDNIFYGDGLSRADARAAARAEGATIFAYRVADPERYGVHRVRRERRGAVDRGKAGAAALDLRRAPGSISTTATSSTSPPRSRPSARGELEITDVNQRLSRRGALQRRAARPRLCLARHRHARLAARGRGLRPDRREAAGPEDRCPEEIAWRMGFIGAEQLLAAAKAHDKSGYGHYLRAIYEGEAKGG